MRCVLQRVTSASVSVDGAEVARIGRGLLVLVGVETGDGPAQVAATADKLAHLRIFEDDAGRMNLGPAAVGAQFLVVSQFTLAGSLDRGRRPSFDGAARPEVAEPLVEALVDALRSVGHLVQTGVFGAEMAVALVNDGPVTFVFDADSQ